jgi:hypothetical protein
MGETASSWKTPLHSSDTEHEWQKRVEQKGKGGAFDIKREEHPSLLTPGDPTAGICGPGVNASSVLTNPFHKG